MTDHQPSPANSVGETHCLVCGLRIYQNTGKIIRERREGAWGHYSPAGDGPMGFIFTCPGSGNMPQNAYYTDLAASRGVKVSVTAHGEEDTKRSYCFDHRRAKLTIELRQIGWLDQKGRVYISPPPQDGFDGGSLTPLLINPGCD